MIENGISFEYIPLTMGSFNRTLNACISENTYAFLGKKDKPLYIFFLKSFFWPLRTYPDRDLETRNLAERLIRLLYSDQTKGAFKDQFTKFCTDTRSEKVYTETLPYPPPIYPQASSLEGFLSLLSTNSDIYSTLVNEDLSAISAIAQSTKDSAGISIQQLYNFVEFSRFVLLEKAVLDSYSVFLRIEATISKFMQTMKQLFPEIYPLQITHDFFIQCISNEYFPTQEQTAPAIPARKSETDSCTGVKGQSTHEIRKAESTEVSFQIRSATSSDDKTAIELLTRRLLHHLQICYYKLNSSTHDIDNCKNSLTNELVKIFKEFGVKNVSVPSNVDDLKIKDRVKSLSKIVDDLDKLSPIFAKMPILITIIITINDLHRRRTIALKDIQIELDQAFSDKEFPKWQPKFPLLLLLNSIWQERNKIKIDAKEKNHLSFFNDPDHIHNIGLKITEKYYTECLEKRKKQRSSFTKKIQHDFHGKPPGSFDAQVLFSMSPETGFLEDADKLHEAIKDPKRFSTPPSSSKKIRDSIAPTKGEQTDYSSKSSHSASITKQTSINEPEDFCLTQRRVSNPVYKDPLIYCDRVLRWFHATPPLRFPGYQNLPLENQQESILFHGFTQTVDQYLFLGSKQGERTIIPAEFSWKEKKWRGAIVYTTNEKGEVYHRFFHPFALGTTEWAIQVTTDTFNIFDFPELNENNDLPSEVTSSSNPTSTHEIIFQHPHLRYVTIKSDNVTIVLYPAFGSSPPEK